MRQLRPMRVLLPFLLLICFMGNRAMAEPIKLVVLGDSLTAGYGLNEEDAFPAKLETALKAKGIDVTVVNAGVSGDTAKQGLERLDWAVDEDADAVIVELGANDALRGIDPNETRASLEKIIVRLMSRNLPVMIAGMLAPPNLGPSYKEVFDRIYPSLAGEHGLRLYPFFLDGVATIADYNLDDGMHPNARGVDEIVSRMAPKVAEFLSQVKP
jgi:acyl-CoA thioesterase-1